MIVAILAFFSGYFAYNLLTQPNITGKVIDKRSYTTAICNDNSCIDVVVYCNSNRVEKIIPISNLTYLENFVDYRQPSEFCSS